MNNTILEYLEKNKKRLLMFLFGCLGTRTALGLFISSKFCNKIICKIVNIAIVAMGLGFLFIYFGDLRKTGLETGGNKIWWNHLRPFHGIMYLIAGYYLFINERKYSSNVILIDTLFGFIAWLLFHIHKIFY